MVIHIQGDNARDTSTMLSRFVERQRGRELRLGRRVIGWNLDETIVMRSDGVSAAQLQKYVRHFAPQRHVVFDHSFPPAALDEYFAMARELRTYMFAFMKPPAGANCPLQSELRERAKHASCEVVTLNPERGIQQLEVLLLASPAVLGTEEPLSLPEAPARRAAARTRSRKTSAAA
jgi:hypothetical protein